LWITQKGRKIARIQDFNYMELKEFVKSVLKDLVEAVDEARTESLRDLYLTSHKETNQTVEFDIAVSAEDATKSGGKAGVHVLHFVEGSGDISKEVKSSTISRIKFGVYIDISTKQENAEYAMQIENNRNNRINDAR